MRGFAQDWLPEDGGSLLTPGVVREGLWEMTSQDEIL